MKVKVRLPREINFGIDYGAIEKIIIKDVLEAYAICLEPLEPELSEYMHGGNKLHPLGEFSVKFRHPEEDEPVVQIPNLKPLFRDWAREWMRRRADGHADRQAIEASSKSLRKFAEFVSGLADKLDSSLKETK